MNLVISIIVGLLCEFNVSHSITQFFENTKSINNSNNNNTNMISQLVNTDIKSEKETKRNDQIQILIKFIECFFVHLLFYSLKQKIDLFFGVVGGICSSALCYVIPVICYLSVDKELKVFPKVFIIFVATIMSSLGLIVSTISVIQLFIK